MSSIELEKLNYFYKRSRISSTYNDSEKIDSNQNLVQFEFEKIIRQTKITSLVWMNYFLVQFS